MLRKKKKTKNLLSILLVVVLLVANVTISGGTTSSASPPSSANKDESQSVWKWRPEVPHPCTVHHMTMEEVHDMFGTEGIPVLYPDPLVIVADDKDRNAKLRHLTQSDQFVSNFPPNFNVTLSSSNSFSQHRRTIPLQQYLDEMKQHNGTTVPNQRSNESWYLFGETYSQEWKNLLQDYQLPPCQACQHHKYVALSFGIGNRGSGVQWHIHGPGFSEALHGRKHWILYPPQYEPPLFHHDQSTRHWMEYIYTNTTQLIQAHEQWLLLNTTAKDSAGKQDNKSKHPILKNGRPYECTLDPGDMIYFPDRWYHATINCDPYTAFVSTFTSDHQYLQDQKMKKKRKHTVFGSESEL